MSGALLLAATALMGCREESAGEPAATRALEVMAVTSTQESQSIVLSGSIAAQAESNLSFRTAGRIIEQLADVGSHVRQGDVLARIDAELQQADVESARAEVEASDAQVAQASAAFARARDLLRRGVGTQRDFDLAEQNLKVAEANAAKVAAQLASSLETLTYTELKADADGLIVSRELDVGEVAAAAATVFRLAHDGPRDAVFDVSERLLLEGEAPSEIAVTAISDPSASVVGSIRQVSPIIDPDIGTVRVKVGLQEVPPQMALGAAVSGAAVRAGSEVFVVPAVALTSLDGMPALWVADQESSTIQARPVKVVDYTTDSVVVSEGLTQGDRIVVQGTKLLRNGQPFPGGQPK
jgi:membrane fusion protein, multidrug efflux system